MNRYNSLNSYLKINIQIYNKSFRFFVLPNRGWAIQVIWDVFFAVMVVPVSLPHVCTTLLLSRLKWQRKEFLQNKNGKVYCAYFQSFTNTYGNVDYLEKIFTGLSITPDIVCLSIVQDLIVFPDDVIDLLNRLNKIKPVWIELWSSDNSP